MSNYVGFEELRGETLTEVIVNGERDEIVFKCVSGNSYLMYHSQDCCESVSIHEIVGGELSELIGEEIILAEKVSSDSNINESNYGSDEEWTFYKLSTMNTSITISWFGQGNGYYSLDVSFRRI